MARGRFGKKLLGVVAGVAAGVLVVLFATPFGKGVRDIAGTGVVQDVLAKPEKQTYDSQDTDRNLEALATGLRLYQESEGAYPAAATWMDDLLPRLITNVLPKKEAEKKLVRPGVAEGEFGYALNDAAAGKYVGDLPKGTILVFESAATGRNAHGDPRKDGRKGGRALTIEGDLVSLPSEG